MSGINAGDSFPADVVFSYVSLPSPHRINPPSSILTQFLSYIPWTEEKGDITSCGIPINYHASKEWANKKVVLFALPGAFTPVCSARHVPEYLEKLPELRAKGVDVVAVTAFNDPFVMSAWGKANQVTGDDIVRGSPPALLGFIPLTLCSSSSPTPGPGSPRASAGPTPRAAPAATPSSSTTARSPTLPVRRR